MDGVTLEEVQERRDGAVREHEIALNLSCDEEEDEELEGVDHLQDSIGLEPRLSAEQTADTEDLEALALRKRT